MVGIKSEFQISRWEQCGQFLGSGRHDDECGVSLEATNQTAAIASRSPNWHRNQVNVRV